jgi:NodT family efflux transporter outer membrane factor (OMF) lipoprotein
MISNQKLAQKSRVQRHCRFALLAVSLHLTACSTLAPNNVRESVVAVNDQVPKTFSSAEAKLDSQADAPKSFSAWWNRFEDPALVTLVEHALANNIDLGIAAERLLQSKALLAKSRSSELPTVDVNGSGTKRYRSNEDPLVFSNNGPRTSTRYLADTTLSWELDFFDRLKTISDANEKRSLASEGDLLALRISIASLAAEQVLQVRQLQSRIRIAQQQLAMDDEIVEVTQIKQRAGIALQADVLRATAVRADNAALRSRLEVDLTSSVRSLAILTAKTPQETLTALSGKALDNNPKIASGEFGVPTEMLRRRPDVARAEFLLQAAALDLAAIQAERYPKFNLSSSIQLIAGSLAKLTTARALAASLIPSVSWRALDFGRLDADIDRTKGAQREALLSYRRAVLTAFAESDSALTELAQRRTTTQLNQEAYAAQNSAWELTNLQYKKGLIDLPTAFETQRSAIRSQENLIQAQYAEKLATVTLFKVMGGGW